MSPSLCDRQLLIVLDNCEQVLVAAASLVQALLEACPRLCVLTTSLQPLGVSVEKAQPELRGATQGKWRSTIISNWRTAN